MSNTVYDDHATTVLLCGVGGQGIILAAHILAQVAAANGDDVKVSEIHGMAQRGGAVTTVVRFGDTVNSMVCCKGTADVLLAFESTEALRNIAYVQRDGNIIVNKDSIAPLSVLSGQNFMPDHPFETLTSYGAHIISAEDIARASGNEQTANVVLLGVLSAFLPFEEISWHHAISSNVPSALEKANISAFDQGRAQGTQIRSKEYA